MSEPGIDVKTSGLKNLLFHSSYPLLKIKLSGSGTVTPGVTGSDEIFDIYTHNLGYIPMFDFFIQWYDPSTGVKNSNYKRTTISDGLAGGFNNLYTAYTTTTQLKLALNLTLGDGASLSYRYYLYYDTIS